MTKVLVVDLDKTLSKIDILAEIATQQLLMHPLGLARRILRFRELLALKKAIASNVTITPGCIPFNPEVLDLIKRRRSAGWTIVLATASVETIARPIAESIQLFDEVICSSEENLKGAFKAGALEARYGAQGFDYVGDSHADKAVWASARGRIFAGTSRRKFKALSRDVEGLVDLGIAPTAWPTVNAMRPSHWVKNLLVFLPLLLLGDITAITAERVMDLSLLFFAMSLAASGLYLVNDILDTNSDRIHPDKSNRSIASGALAAHMALLVSITLALMAGVLSWSAGGALALGLVAAYALGSYLYSAVLKKQPLLDIVFLTLLYLSRIFIGASLVEIPVSFWLAVFAFFAFLSLASVKRLVELRLTLDASSISGSRLLSNRGYLTSDIEIVQPLGIAFAVASQLVLALYIHATFGYQGEVALVPMSLLLFWTIWMLGIWLDFARGQMDSDPVKHALKNKRSLVLLALISISFVVSKSL
ncbi:MAG: hypothetical protein RL718_403 [Actinomycetota bacterium]